MFSTLFCQVFCTYPKIPHREPTIPDRQANSKPGLEKFHYLFYLPGWNNLTEPLPPIQADAMLWFYAKSLMCTQDRLLHLSQL